MDREDVKMWVGLSVLAIIVMAAMWKIGAGVTHDHLKREAAEHGAGRWVVDPKTGKTNWEWTGREE